MKRKMLISIALIFIMLLNCIMPCFVAYATQGEEIQLNSDLYAALTTNLRDKGIVFQSSDITHSISISQEAIAQVTRLELNESDISDLTGLENFTALTYLDLSGNDLSEESNLGVLNSLTNLEYLDLSSNKIGSVEDIRATMELLDAPNKSFIITNQVVIKVWTEELATGEEHTMTDETVKTFEVPTILELAGYIKSAWQHVTTQAEAYYDTAPTIKETSMYYGPDNNTVKLAVSSADGSPYYGLLKYEIYINDSDTEASSASNTNPAATNKLKGSRFTMYFVSHADYTDAVVLPDDNLYDAVKEQLTAGQTVNPALSSYPYTTDADGNTIYYEYIYNSFGSVNVVEGTKTYEFRALYNVNNPEAIFFGGDPDYYYCETLNLLLTPDQFENVSYDDGSVIRFSYTIADIQKYYSTTSEIKPTNVEIENPVNGMVVTFRGYKIAYQGEDVNITLYERAYDEPHVLIISDVVIVNKITSLILNNEGIRDLSGIEYFDGLVSTLNVSHNYLENIQPIIALAAHKESREESLRATYNKYLKTINKGNLTYSTTSSQTTLNKINSEIYDLVNNLGDFKGDLKTLAENADSTPEDVLNVAKAIYDATVDISGGLKSDGETTVEYTDTKIYQLESDLADLNGYIDQDFNILTHLYNIYAKEYKLTNILPDSVNFMTYEEYHEYLGKVDPEYGGNKTKAYAVLNEMVTTINGLYSKDAISPFEDALLSKYFPGVCENDNDIPFTKYFENYFEAELDTIYLPTIMDKINTIRHIALYSELTNYCLIERMEKGAPNGYCYEEDYLYKKINELNIEGIDHEYEDGLLEAIRDNDDYDDIYTEYKSYKAWELIYDSGSDTLPINICEGEYQGKDLRFGYTPESYALSEAEANDLIEEVLNKITFVDNPADEIITDDGERITVPGKTAAEKRAEAQLRLQHVFEYFGMDMGNGTDAVTAIYDIDTFSKFFSDIKLYEDVENGYKSNAFSGQEDAAYLKNYRGNFFIYNQMMSLANKLVNGNVNRYVYIEKLKRLNISYNAELSDISDVSQLTDLVELNAEACYISDVTNVDWSALSKLRKLNLGYNFISDISPLLQLERLEELILRENLIKGALEITDQQYINLFGRSSDKKDIKLKNLDLSGNYITDITSLLRYLDAITNGDYSDYLAREDTINMNLQNQKLTINVEEPVYLDEHPSTIKIDLPPIFTQLKAIDEDRTEFGITSGEGRIEKEGQYVVVNTRTTGDKVAVAEVVAMNGDHEEDTCIGLGTKVTIRYNVVGRMVESIIITPPTGTTVKAGNTKQFAAEVEGENLTEYTVTWSIQNNTSEGTTISKDGLLTVASDEQADTIKVIATSDDNRNVMTSVLINVEKSTQPGPSDPTDPEDPENPTNVTVTVNPEGKTVPRGQTQLFNAQVNGTNLNDTTVTWSVSGNSSQDTKIYPSGLLLIASDETSETLTITATSNADNTAFASVTVTVSLGKDPQYTVDDDLQVGYNVVENNNTEYLTTVRPKTSKTSFEDKLLENNNYSVKVYDNSDGHLHEVTNGYMKTGYIVKIVDENDNVVMDSNGNYYEYTVVVRGDLNSDGVADSLDSLLLKGVILESVDLGKAAELAADVDLDNNIDTDDGIYLLYHRAEVKNFNLNNQ